jgi:hypothetical protein
LAIASLAHRLGEIGNQALSFAGGDHVGEQRQRLRVDERDRATDHHERISRPPRRCPRLEPRQPQHRHNVGVVPFEGDGERQDVEVADGRLRFKGEERRSRRQLRLQLLFRWQKHPLAHHIVYGVEEPVGRLEPEARHADEISVRERQGDTQASAMRLLDEADFPGKHLPGAVALFLPLLR